MNDASENPRISVVIPCYNGAPYLSEAIESCLRQTMTDFEIVIVDDASPDDCAQIAERFARSDRRIRLIRREKNGGVSAAFNSGFAVARGRFFTRLAQDDVFYPDALAKLCGRLEASPDTGLVYGGCEEINEDGSLRGAASVPEPETALLFGNRVGLCAAWRREVWEKLGGFNPHFDAAEDYEYWVRIWNHYPIKSCGSAPLLRARRHAEMGSLLYAERQEQATLRVLRESFPTRITPPWRRKLAQRAAISRTLFGAATQYRWKGQTRLALTRVVGSLLVWPLPYKHRSSRTWFPRIRCLLSLMVSAAR
jgi:glycosyltransferase involved in cell wall biosynthesis